MKREAVIQAVFLLIFAKYVFCASVPPVSVIDTNPKNDSKIEQINLTDCVITHTDLGNIQYNFIKGKPLTCPKCKKNDGVKFEAITGDLHHGYLICVGCGYKKKIRVTYADESKAPK
jgi:Zn ribbon nucleic-acid-binding protein